MKMFVCSLVAQMLKHLPTMRETQVQSLGWEDLLEKEMATHFSILAWKIPWLEKPVGYSPWGRKESDTTERLHFHFTFYAIHSSNIATGFYLWYILLYSMSHTLQVLCSLINDWVPGMVLWVKLFQPLSRIYYICCLKVLMYKWRKNLSLIFFK